MIYLSTLLLSLFITISLIPVFIRLAGRMHAIDMPAPRKVHKHPIPRMGGLAIAVGAFAPAFLWAQRGTFFNAYAIGAGIIVLFGMVDDLKGLNYRIKFIGQFTAALVAVLYGGIRIENLGALVPEGMLLPAWVAIPLTVVVIVGVTNAINLADGLDGLAGGICLLSFCCIGYIAYLCGNALLALIAVSLIGAIFGFLRFNTYPASLFMGDSGSQFLGFSLAAISISLTQGNLALSPVLPLIILGFPILDTLTVMYNRIAEGRSPFSADNNHFHHRLIRLGLFHTEAVFTIYIIQAFLVTSAFLLRFHSDWLLLIGFIIFSCLLVSGFFIAGRKGLKFKRFNLVDKAAKGRLKELREKGYFIQLSFKTVEIELPLLLLISCFIPTYIPAYLSIFSGALIGILCATWYFKKKRIGEVLGLVLYLFIPFIVYFSEKHTAVWLTGNPSEVYNLCYLVLAISAIVTLKATKRRQGFKITTMDFLILFIALVVPYATAPYFPGSHMGNMPARIVTLFFSYETLIGELRGGLNNLTVFTIISLAVVVVRGFVG